MGVHHEILHDFHADMTGRLKAERRNPVRQIQIVIDRFRHMDDLDPADRSRFQFERREGRVVSADGDQTGNAETRQSRQHAIEMLGLSGRIRPRSSQIRPAPEVNAADFINRQGLHAPRVPFHQPFEAVDDPEDVTAAENAADRDGADHAVDAGSRPAPDQYSHGGSLRCHVNPLHLCPTVFQLLHQLRHGCILHLVKRQPVRFNRERTRQRTPADCPAPSPRR